MKPGDPLSLRKKVSAGGPGPDHCFQGPKDLQRHLIGLVEFLREAPETKGARLVAVVSFRDAHEIKDDGFVTADDPQPGA